MHYKQLEEELEGGKWSTVSDRRVLLTFWVAKAWEIINRRYGPTIIQTVRHVEMRMARDGSQDGEFQVKGWMM